MNIEAYISSGILEAYAIGELTSSEKAEVERLMLEYPELRTELNKIELAQEKLLMATGIEAPGDLKERIFGKIDQASPQSETGTPISIGSTKIIYWQYAAAASFLLAILSSWIAYRYADELRNTKAELREIIALNQQFAQDYNQVNQNLQSLEKEVEVISNLAFQRIELAGTDNAPNAKATVFWHAENEELYLKIQTMQALASNQQYQLWAIIDGKPVDAGVFDANTNELLSMKNIKKGATAFAVTIEPRGGQESPSLETMQVIGAVPESKG